MLAFCRAILAQFDTFRLLLLVFRTRIIDTITNCTLKMDCFAHGY